MIAETDDTPNSLALDGIMMLNVTAHSITIPEAMAVPMTSTEVLVAAPLARLKLTAPAACALQTRFLESGRVLGRNHCLTQTEPTSCANILTVWH
jgi:hypothetical protein